MGSFLDHVPPEVLGRIFIECLSEARYIRPDRKRAPLIFSEICRTWWAVATSTPQLWSSLTIRVYPRNFPILQFPAKQVELWLDRSGNLPLCLRLQFERDTASLDVQSILDAVKRYSFRCLNIRLEMMFTHICQLMSDPALSWPLLESLVLRIRSGPGVVDENLTISHNSPRLRRLVLHRAPYFFDTGRLDIAWAKLKAFVSKSSLFHDDSMSTLRKSPNLIHCTPGPITRKIFPNFLSPLVHTSLTSISFDTSVELGLLFDNLTLPLLHHLKVRFIKGSISLPWPSSHILSFLSRSACSLETLTVEGQKILEDHLLACLETVPSLSVVINQIHVPDNNDPFNNHMVDVISESEKISQILAVRQIQREVSEDLLGKIGGDDIMSGL